MKNLVKALGILTFVGGVWKLGKIAGYTGMAVELGKHPEKAQEIHEAMNDIKEKIHSNIKKAEELEEETMTEEESVEEEGEAEPEEE